MAAPAKIEKVVARLDKIVDRAIADDDAFGLFASLYRAMTARVARGLAKKMFKNREMMERLLAAFAARYFEAFDLYEAGGEPARAWRKAFEFAEGSAGTYIHHLLLGINAHINLDLAVAVARTVPAKDLAGFRRDYDAINDVLADLMEPAKEVISEHSSMIDLLDRVFGDADDAVFGFSLDAARDFAWTNAEILVALPADLARRHIVMMDKSAALVADRIASPSPVTGVLKIGECEDGPEVMAALRAL